MRAKTPNNTLLVTGGAGFIGSNFVQMAITQKSQHVMIVDKLTYAGHRANLEPVEKNFNFEFVRADIGDERKMEELLETVKPRAVLNFAAETHVDRSIDSPASFIETNIVGTFRLLEASRRYHRSLSQPERARFRFLHVSTDEVFGALGASGRFKESSPYKPNSPYSASKAAADHLVRAYGTTYGLPVLVTNSSNNYGPHQFPEKFIPLLILNAIEGKDLPIYGDGRHVRDWIFVGDHAEGIWRVLQKGTPGETYNIGSGEEHPNVKVVDVLCEILEDLAPAKTNGALVARGFTRYHALKKFVKDRPGHDRRYAIDASKIRKELGWAPKFSFEKALKKTAAWYLSHRDWCESVQKNNYNRERLGLAEGVEVTQA